MVDASNYGCGGDERYLVSQFVGVAFFEGFDGLVGSLLGWRVGGACGQSEMIPGACEGCEVVGVELAPRVVLTVLAGAFGSGKVSGECCQDADQRAYCRAYQ